MAFMLHNFGVKPMIMLFILNILLKPRFLVSFLLVSIYSICRKGLSLWKSLTDGEEEASGNRGCKSNVIGK